MEYIVLVVKPHTLTFSPNLILNRRGSVELTPGLCCLIDDRMKIPTATPHFRVKPLENANPTKPTNVTGSRKFKVAGAKTGSSNSSRWRYAINKIPPTSPQFSWPSVSATAVPMTNSARYQTYKTAEAKPEATTSSSC